MSFKVNHLIYAGGHDFRNTIRTAVTFTEPVNPDALRIAADRTAARFPYHYVRMVCRGGEYLFEPNPAPVVITPGGGTVTLGSAQSNEHLIALAYDGNRLFLDASHFCTDGNGMFPMLRTLIYCYLHILHPDEPFDTDIIAMPDSAISAAEAEDDPYPADPLPENPIGFLPRPDAVFLLDDQPQGYAHMPEWTSFCLKTEQKSMMTYVSSADGSPASFISALMFRAVSDLHPANQLPVVCGMQHQFRKAIGKPFSHLCHVNIAPIIYPDRLRGGEIGRLNTVTRGALICGADDSVDVLSVNAHIRSREQIKTMTLPEKKRFMQQYIREQIGLNTFEVSYTGRVPWGGLDRYITNAVPYLDMTLSGGISVEIFSFGAYFSINIMQRSSSRKYVDRLCALLTDCGISYTEEPPEHFQLCDFAAPAQ